MKTKHPPEDFTADAMPVNQQEDEDTIREEEKAAAWAEFEAEMRMLNMENDYETYK